MSPWAMQKFIIILIVNWYDDMATCVILDTQNYMHPYGRIVDVEEKKYCKQTFTIYGNLVG